MSGSGTKADPWNLPPPAGGGAFQMHFDEEKSVFHCQVGSTWLHYRAEAVDDLYAMLKAHGDWMELGNKDEKQAVKEGTVEAWARSEDNPIGGWYGLRKGYKGRFANYVSAILREQGKAEYEKRGRSWWVRAI